MEALFREVLSFFGNDFVTTALISALMLKISLFADKHFVADSRRDQLSLGSVKLTKTVSDAFDWKKTKFAVDAVFGEKLISPRSIGVSALISFVLVLIGFF